jgi:hypothetical protein
VDLVAVVEIPVRRARARELVDPRAFHQALSRP